MDQPLRVTPALLMLEGEHTGRLFELNRSSTTIGRNPEFCDIVLNSLKVSRRHARITRQSHGYELRDLESRSGTRVNSRIVNSPHALIDGDLIQISETLFQFQSTAVLVEEGTIDGIGLLGVLRTAELTAFTASAPAVNLRSKVDALVEISRTLTRTLGLKEVLETTLETLFRIFPSANRGFALLRGEGSGELTLAAARHNLADADRMKISRSIIDYVFSERQAILIQDVSEERRLKITDSIRESAMRTVMCAPLLDSEGRPMGLIQIDTINQRNAFSQEDLDILALAAGQVATAMENARLHEQIVAQARKQAEDDHARRIQRAFLPKQRPDVPGYVFWDFYESAESVGGDYFAYFPIPAASANPLPLSFDGNGHGRAPLEQLGVALGDVSGKGMPAALIMARLSAEARVLANSETAPSAMIERLNERLHEDDLDGMFVTFLLAWFDLARDRADIVRAGHMGPLLRRDDEVFDAIGEASGGPPLAILRDRRYASASLQLQPGDVLILYTDGVTEAMSPRNEIFGLERLRKVIRNASPDAQKIGEAIVQAVRRHCDYRGLSDDLTLVCIGKRKPSTLAESKTEVASCEPGGAPA